MTAGRIATGAVQVLGAGPAGCAAALAALAEGPVEIFEKSRFPRHKVCGEFLSPQCAVILDRLGVAAAFSASGPAAIQRMKLRFGDTESTARFSDSAWGLSRYTLDSLLWQEARKRGAAVVAQTNGRQVDSAPIVIAYGRRSKAPRGRRLFGFKAHFTGPCDDAVELYFFAHRAYLGVSPVENGFTNVCGIADESQLARFSFDIDAFLDEYPAVRSRLLPLRRCWKWLVVGPVEFDRSFDRVPARLEYPAGDALAFVDPFTGSGILSALWTGELAGRMASQGQQPEQYLRLVRKSLRTPVRMAGLFRYAMDAGWGKWLAPYLPAGALFRLTRPAAL
jgi:hypothetical protein